MRKQQASLAARICGMLLAGVLGMQPLTAAADLFPQDEELPDNMGYTEDGVWMYNDYGDGTVSITCMDTEAVEVTVPSVIDGKTITMVEVDAFKDCLVLEKVVLPATITVIEDYAFYGCTALKEVNIPNSVVNIGWQAFYHCAKLESVTIPASVESIEEFVFEGCEALKEIRVSDANKQYKDVDGVLFDFEGTTLIRYPSAREDAVYVIPDGCRKIEEWAFIGNTFLEQVDVNDVEEIGEEAFYYCTSLQSFTVPEGITELPRYTFANCHSLQSVQLPASLEVLGTGCFYSCMKLEQLEIPDALTTMEDYALFNCPSLKQISLTSHVTSIGEYALGYYNDENDEYKHVPDFVIDAKDDTQAFAYAAEHSIRCTGGITEGTVFIYIIIGVVVLVIAATIGLVIVQHRIKKRHELI